MEEDKSLITWPGKEIIEPHTGNWSRKTRSEVKICWDQSMFVRTEFFRPVILSRLDRFLLPEIWNSIVKFIHNFITIIPKLLPFLEKTRQTKKNKQINKQHYAKIQFEIDLFIIISVTSGALDFARAIGAEIQNLIQFYFELNNKDRSWLNFKRSKLSGKKPYLFNESSLLKVFVIMNNICYIL